MCQPYIESASALSDYIIIYIYTDTNPINYPARMHVWVTILHAGNDGKFNFQRQSVKNSYTCI